MKNQLKIIPFLALFLLLSGMQSARAFCGFYLPVDTTPVVPSCNCGVNNTAIMRTTASGCETRCVSSRIVKHYTNKGWTYGCCLAARFGNSEPASLRIYPNPATDILHIEFSIPAQGKVVLILYDAMGCQLRLLDELVPSGGINFSLPLDDLAAGIYYLRLNTPEVSQVQKFIISGK